jgi:hypothetical protein
MSALVRVFIAGLFATAFALTPVRGQEGPRPIYSGSEYPRGCLSPRERRALIESGAVLRLVAVMRMVRITVPGFLVGAQLCRRPDGFVYLLTLLAFDGKVTQVVVDAVKGTMLGKH